VEERDFVIGLTLANAPSGIACLGAHPDDIEIGAAATIATLAEANPACRFTFAIATGDGLRAEEARVSAAKLLGDRVTIDVAGFSDGSLPYEDPAGVKAFFRASLEAADADIVFCPATIDLHQDHRFIGELAHQIARDHLILQYEIHKSDGDLSRPGVYVPLSTGQAVAKLDHLDAHFASQHGKPWYDREALQAMLRLRGVECRAPDGYAEAFRSDRLVIR
jgi:LmbE family N-acetylglucosaminyl deacetylase